MTDITESNPIEHELRDIARWFIHRATSEAEPETKQSHTNDARICSKAADEIEQLRAKLEWMPDGGPDGIDCRNETIKLQDENVKRLRIERDNARQLVSEGNVSIVDLGDNVDELEAEIEQLRAEIDDLRARVAMLEADENEGSAITAMPIQIGDELCYLPVNAHGIVKMALMKCAEYPVPMIDIPSDIHPATQTPTERMIAILESHGIEMEVAGCGCCGSPEVTFKYRSESILYRSACCDFFTRSASSVETPL